MNNSIYNRRSIRKYLDKQVPRELIGQIIDAGRMAPSAKNRQPWQYIVLGGENKSEFLKCMWKGILREEDECAMLPNSKNGITDAKNTPVTPCRLHFYLRMELLRYRQMTSNTGSQSAMQIF